jgi:CheY-like chemotaxis protein
MTTTVPKPRHLLLVEDNRGDARLVAEAIKDFTNPLTLHVAEDAEEALSFIRVSDPRPDLVILDLNLPTGDGRQVLLEIKNDPNSWSVPVIVLSTSDAPRDVAKCYEIGANAYLRKPVDVNEFLDMMDLIDRFWLGYVVQP